MGKQIELPFSISDSHISKLFEFIHSDAWTSPKLSISGICYYDHYSLFLWVYPFPRKGEVFSKFLNFMAYEESWKHNFKLKFNHFNETMVENILTPSSINILILKEYKCYSLHTSQQNGKSESMICTSNSAVHAFLFQAKLSLIYWVGALHVVVHTLNILPSSAIRNHIPFIILFNKSPRYDYMKVFGCLCFLNINLSHLHKLSSHSKPCLFLGYPSQHRRYICMDLQTKKIIISCHVIFDETLFLAAETNSSLVSYTFLDSHDEPSPIFKNILQTPSLLPPMLAQQIPPPLPPTAPANVPIPTGHSMQTRSKQGIRKPKTQFSLLTAVSPLPNSHIQALYVPNWSSAMADDYDAMIKTKTWTLLPRPRDVNIVRFIWLFKHKINADGSLSCNKARLVANGKSQEAGIYYNETFNPVVKPATIRTVLHLSLRVTGPFIS